MSGFESAWADYRQRTERALKARISSESGTPRQLGQAMEYVCLEGGKRFRAMLVYACGELVGVPADILDTPACAVEMVHAYSLTHDDLPAMDDDDLRRGKATCHKQFDEPTAILAGDALQSRAFEILASNKWNPVSFSSRCKMIEELSSAIGSNGMAGGQAMDMQATGKATTFPQLKEIHKLKTGALIEASAVIGVLGLEGVDEQTISKVRRYASCIGLAFQITDDILDCTSDSETLGKEAGADSNMEKSTYVSILGLEAARNEAQKLSVLAIESLRGLGDNITFLEELSHFVKDRSF